MKKLILLVLATLLINPLFAQITITADDMPTAKDTLRYSNAVPYISPIDLSVKGANKVWDFSDQFAITQHVDSYHTTAELSALYALGISPSAYGYKIADSIPGLSMLLPVSITDFYNFFEKTSGPSTYIKKAYGATVGGFTVPINYTSPDVIYHFPLNYLSTDSANYLLDFSAPTFGGIYQEGYRKNVVDAWGIIKTPYFKTPVSCIRVRSEKHETDSVSYSDTTIGLQLDYTEYKWLVKGQHYPAMFVTTYNILGTEVITSIQYRDTIRYLPWLGVANTVAPKNYNITAYPNPVTNNVVSLTIPADWTDFKIMLFDMSGRLTDVYANKRELNMQSLPAGHYIARIMHNSDIAYLKIEKQ